MSRDDALAESSRASMRRELVPLVLLGGVLVASVVWHPSDDGGLIVCPFRRATGLPCPGCGLTRSFCAVAKGELARGFQFHYLGPLLFAVICVYFVRSIALVLGFEGAPARFDALVRRTRLVRIGIVAFVIAWIVRLVVLGVSGQLVPLAHDGEFMRWLF